jgi:PKD repeat protein
MHGSITQLGHFSQDSVLITITTLHQGLEITVDSQPYTAPQTFRWLTGSLHSIGTSTPQSGGSGGASFTRYIYDRWSDGGAISHTISIPDSATTYTAFFTTQHYLTMEAATGGTVSPASGWRDSTSTVQIQAISFPEYSFSHWTGIGNGSYSGPDSVATVTMYGPITQTGSFSEIIAADFRALSTSGLEPLTVEFLDLSIGNVTSWAWSFGDGGSSFEQNPSHIYNDFGTYTVRLQVNNEPEMIKENYIKVIKVNVPSSTSNDTIVPIVLTTPPNFDPEEKILNYRFGGKRSFEILELQQLEIPAELITIRGLEYYITLIDSGDTITYPQDDPEIHPAIIRVKFSDYFPLESELVLPVEQYEMVSVPLEIEDPRIMSVFGDDYGDYNWQIWRLYRWSGSRKKYNEYPELNSEVNSGNAFWLITEQGKVFDIDGLSQNSADSVRLMLETGWNQVGNPWAFPVAWADVLNSDSLNTPTEWDSRHNQYMHGQKLLRPWTGYFVFNPNSTPVEIVIPPIEKDSSQLSTGAPLALNEFILKIGIEGLSSGWRDDQNFVGMLQDARNGLDTRDYLEAPPMVERIRLSILDEGRGYAGNFVSPVARGTAWEMELTTHGSRESARIWIEDIDKLPSDYSLSLIDQTRQLAIELTDGQATLVVPSQGEVKQLRLLVGTSEYIANQEEELRISAMQYALHQNYPNPFNPETVISYQLLKNCYVKLDIYNPLGQRIRSLVNREQEAGHHGVTWDGANDSGEQVSSGIYFYRITTGEFNAMRKLILLR